MESKGMTKRREFIKIVGSIGFASGLASTAHAGDKLDPNDPYAKTAGYVTNAASASGIARRYFQLLKARHNA